MWKSTGSLTVDPKIDCVGSKWCKRSQNVHRQKFHRPKWKRKGEKNEKPTKPNQPNQMHQCLQLSPSKLMTAKPRISAKPRIRVLQHKTGTHKNCLFDTMSRWLSRSFDSKLIHLCNNLFPSFGQIWQSAESESYTVSPCFTRGQANSQRKTRVQSVDWGVVHHGAHGMFKAHMMWRWKAEGVTYCLWRS